MSAWVLDFQGLGAGEEVDEKGIGGEKGRNEALMKPSQKRVYSE